MTICPEDRATLVDLARAAVEAEVTGGGRVTIDNPAGVLTEQLGCFVTLTNEGRLRGCIGTFVAQDPLARTVVELGSAAARDPRFFSNPITPGELGELRVEVSVLSQLTETDAPEKLTLGKHGIYIVCGGQSGCFLPEVATDMNWSVQEFLDNCCTHKAALPPGAWRDKDTKVYLFTSEKFDH